MLRCLLVDDEHLALALLDKYIADTPGLMIVEKCRSAIRAVEVLQAEAIDLLFLDIQMPLLSGTRMLRAVTRKPVTIFTTAYPQHAVEAFDLDAADYLLKPYSFERFSQAVGKARALLDLRQATFGVQPLSGHVAVKADRRWVNIPLADIRYIEGWKEYVKIHTDHEKWVTLESLNALESSLPAAHFLRVHKSYIVAKGRVLLLDGEYLVLTGGARVPVARARKKQVTEVLFRGG